MDVVGPDGFEVRDVTAALTVVARLRGLIGRPGSSLLLLTGAVHGFHLDRDLIAIGLDRRGVVVAVRPLRRRRMVWIRGARWILEVAPGGDLPRTGDRLHLARGGSEPGADAGQALSVCHPDRQPR